jgi:hypothetical protein
VQPEWYWYQIFTVNAASVDSAQKVLLIQVKNCLNERSIQVEMRTCCVPKISHTASGTVTPSMLILERLPFSFKFSYIPETIIVFEVMSKCCVASLIDALYQVSI